MNGFYKLKARLRKEGWYVGWNLGNCQGDAWGALPDYHDARYNEGGYLVHPETGKEMDWKTRAEVYEEIDPHKVLFNHSQDCQVHIEGEECSECEGSGYDEDFVDQCTTCFGIGKVLEGFDPANYDTSVSGFICHTPDTQEYSLFCFSGSKEGVANLQSILPIIEECGCDIYWDGKGDTRPEISW